nr:hypothetical protein [Pyrobaculum sp.]
MSVIEVYVYGKGSGVRIAKVLDFFRRPVNYVAVRARGRAPCAFEISERRAAEIIFPAWGNIASGGVLHFKVWG